MTRSKTLPLVLLSFAVGTLAGIAGSVAPLVEPAVTRSSWCPTPEQRASGPAFVTEDGAVVEEVPLTIGGPDDPR